MKLLTAAYIFRAVVAFLGRTAFIRKAPDISGRWQIVVHNYQGVPPDKQGFLEGIHFVREQLAAAVAGHSTKLRKLTVRDELTMGGHAGELSQTHGSGRIAGVKRESTQVRYLGIGIIGATQNLSNINDTVKDNSATIACFNCRNPREAREAQRLLSAPEDTIPKIQNSRVGEVYLRSDGIPHVVHLQVPEFDMGAYPGEERVRRHMAPFFAWLNERTIFSPQDEPKGNAISYLKMLNEESAVQTMTPQAPATNTEMFFEEHRLLLQRVHDASTDGVTQHYRALGWSAGRGQRVKRELLEMGLVSLERQRSTSGRPKEILVMTLKGKELLNAK